jgi:hypothetical protein
VGTSVRTSQETHYISTTEPINDVWRNSRCLLWEHINTLCGQNLKFQYCHVMHNALTTTLPRGPCGKEQEWTDIPSLITKTCHENLWGSGGIAPSFLTSWYKQRWVSGQPHSPGYFTSVEIRPPCVGDGSPSRSEHYGEKNNYNMLTTHIPTPYRFLGVANKHSSTTSTCNIYLTV